MSQDKPRARKSVQRDAYASGKRVMPKACLRHDDAAIGLSWLTRMGAVLSPCRVMSETCFQHDTKVLASMPIQ